MSAELVVTVGTSGTLEVETGGDGTSVEVSVVQTSDGIIDVQESAPAAIIEVAAVGPQGPAVDITFAGDTGSDEVNTADTWSFLSGTDGISTTVTDDVLTITLSDELVAVHNGGDLALTNLDLAGYIDLAEIAAPAAPGADTLRMWAEDNNGISVLHFQSDLGIDHELGRDLLVIVRNDTGSTITAGQAVYISGSNGITPQVALAQADAATTMPSIGIVVADITTNSFGQVCFAGDARGFDTSSFSAGDVLYVSPTTPGALTTTIPTGSHIPQRVGVVVTSNPSQGIIKVMTGSELNPALTQTFTNKTLTDPIFDNDLFINSGGVINWNSGDATITASATTMDFTGPQFYGFEYAGTGYLQLQNSSTPVSGGSVNLIQYRGKNSAGTELAYAQTLTYALDVTPGTEDGIYYVGVASAGGGIAYQHQTRPGTFRPHANDGTALGETGANWSDLFLASGAVINFNAGDVTLTHAANEVELAGGKLVIESGGTGTINLGSNTGLIQADGTHMYVRPSTGFLYLGAEGGNEVVLTTAQFSPSTTDGCSLGSTGNKWSDLFLASGAVINFDSGDVTVTHAANSLSFEGANSYTFDNGINVGVEDTTQGLLNLYGSNTGEGGELRLFTAGDDDTTYNFWFLDVDGTGNFRIGRQGTTELSVDLTNANFNFQANDLTTTGAISSGDATFTGVVDAGGATSLEIPNGTGPTVNADGEIALDTSVTNWSHGVPKIYGGEELAILAMPIANFGAATDTNVIAYNATNDELEFVSAGGGGGGGSLPIGAVIAWPTATPPTGTLQCDGSAVSRTTYADLFAVISDDYGAGDGSTTFNLPDYRGEFLRGYDDGAGNDPDAASRTDRGDTTTGDAVGTKQSHALEDHTHEIYRNQSAQAGTNRAITWPSSQTTSISTQLVNGSATVSSNETRARNVAVNWVIAYE